MDNISESQVPSAALDAIFCSVQQKPLAVFPLTWRDRYNAAGGSYLQETEQRIVFTGQLPDFCFFLLFQEGSINI